MSFLTVPSNISKVSLRDTIYFDVNAFLAEVNITDDFFKNRRNWRNIVLHYKNGEQNIYVNLNEDFTQGHFEFSELSRSGIWSLNQIKIVDSYMGQYLVKRDDIISPENYDIQVDKIVAPSSTVTVIKGQQTTSSPLNSDPYCENQNDWTIVSQSCDFSFLDPNFQLFNNTVEQSDFIMNSASFPVNSGKKYRVTINVINVVLTAIEDPEGSGNWVDGTLDVMIGLLDSNDQQIISQSSTYQDGESRSFSFDYVCNQTDVIKLTTEIMGNGFDMTIDSFDIVEIIDAKDSIVIPYADKDFYRPGYKCKLWDTNANTWFSSQILEIGEYTDHITFDLISPIVDVLGSGPYQLRFPDYDYCTANQKGRFAFVDKGF